MVSYVNVHAILEGRRSRAKASSSNDYDSSQVFFPFSNFHHKYTENYIGISHAYSFFYRYCAHNPLLVSMFDMWNFLNILLSSSHETQGGEEAVKCGTLFNTNLPKFLTWHLLVYWYNA